VPRKRFDRRQLRRLAFAVSIASTAALNEGLKVFAGYANQPGQQALLLALVTLLSGALAWHIEPSFFKNGRWGSASPACCAMSFCRVVR
jgi:hypothetical protein